MIRVIMCLCVSVNFIRSKEEKKWRKIPPSTFHARIKSFCLIFSSDGFFFISEERNIDHFNSILPCAYHTPEQLQLDIVFLYLLYTYSNRRLAMVSSEKTQKIVFDFRIPIHIEEKLINFVCFVYLPFIYFQFNVFRKINIEVYNHNLKLILKLLRNDFYACFVYVPIRNGIYSLEHLLNIDCILMDRTKREKSYFPALH